MFYVYFLIKLFKAIAFSPGIMMLKSHKIILMELKCFQYLTWTKLGFNISIIQKCYNGLKHWSLPGQYVGMRSVEILKFQLSTQSIPQHDIY